MPATQDGVSLLIESVPPALLLPTLLYWPRYAADQGALGKLVGSVL